MTIKVVDIQEEPGSSKTTITLDLDKNDIDFLIQLGFTKLIEDAIELEELADLLDEGGANES